LEDGQLALESPVGIKRQSWARAAGVADVVEEVRPGMLELVRKPLAFLAH